MKTKFNKESRNLLIALLLGDGTISNNFVFKIAHCDKQKDYLEWKIRQLKDSGIRNSGIKSYIKTKGFNAGVPVFYTQLNIVPFIKNLINPNRPKIEDLPRDKEGRAIVDITNPPIYKDADYFRQAALFYLKNDCYTKLRPNSNPNSEYRKYWREELRRCREGLIRQSDGMYVTGFLYWFLNYCPMMINEYQEGKKKAIRKEGFGYFFEGIWWRFLYLNNARENGHHAAELAKRGCGKSISLSLSSLADTPNT